MPGISRNKFVEKTIMIKSNFRRHKMAKIWLEHIHIVTSDPMKLAAFYEKAFGAKITRTGTLPNGGAAVSLDLGGTRLAIMVPDTPDKRDPPVNPHKHFGLEHLGVRTDDVESVVKRAVAEGATIMQNAAPPGVKFVYLMTPENIMIEVSEAK
jgi:catechol 2,3-dioxygenase-like lactoylglutathione lyase family enzyme